MRVRRGANAPLARTSSRSFSSRRSARPSRHDASSASTSAATMRPGSACGARCGAGAAPATPLRASAAPLEAARPCCGAVAALAAAGPSCAKKDSSSISAGSSPESIASAARPSSPPSSTAHCPAPAMGRRAAAAAQPRTSARRAAAHSYTAVEGSALYAARRRRYSGVPSATHASTLRCGSARVMRALGTRARCSGRGGRGAARSDAAALQQPVRPCVPSRGAARSGTVCAVARGRCGECSGLRTYPWVHTIHTC